MNDFISAIRMDRKRELFQLKNLNYLEPQKYYKTGVIGVKFKNKIHNFGFNTDGWNTSFFIVDDGANCYLTLHDLYDCFMKMDSKEGMGFSSNILQRQLVNYQEQIKDVFIYQGIEYEMIKTAECYKDGEVVLDNASCGISYSVIFMLVNLIQNKSNVLYLRGNNDEYLEGTIRLFIALLSLEEDREILTTLGWRWNCENNRFDYNEINFSKESEYWKRKYCLTETELRSIM